MVIPSSKEFERKQDLYLASQKGQLSTQWPGLEVCLIQPSCLNQTPLLTCLSGAIEYSVTAPRLVNLILQEANSLNLSINFINVNKVGFFPPLQLGQIYTKTSREGVP